MPVAAPPVDRSTLRLSEVARHVVIPEGIVESLWPEVSDRIREFGDEFDVWQDGLGTAVLGLRADGTFAATVGGVTLSIPRQVAKTFFVGRIVVALCTMFPGLTVLWTAHHGSTATKAFGNLKALVSRPSVRGYVAPGRNHGLDIRDANGEQQIRFRNGSVIMVGARGLGFGRGFDEVDIIVFDEAQILPVRALEDMVAATNQSRFVHGALVFYMGTPPRPSDDGQVFAERRAEALAAKRLAKADDPAQVVQAGDSLYVECSADANVGRPGGPDLDDPAQVEKANPSVPLRTPWISIRRLRKQLKSDDSWRREGLGVWDDNSLSSLISRTEWRARLGIAPEPQTICYAVRFSIDGARVALAVGVRPADGPVHVEVVAAQPMSMGTAWLTDWLMARWQQAARIVVDGKSNASVLVNALRGAGVPAQRIVTPSTEQVVAAHAGLLEAVRTGGLTHNDQPGLETVVAHAIKRKVGTAGGWAWQSMDDDTDVTPLDAATWAWWAASTAKAPGRGRSNGNRRGWVA